MKKLLTLIALAACIIANAQSGQDDIDRKQVNLSKIDQLRANQIGKADYIYNTLSSYYPSDSLIIFHAAKFYCKYGSMINDTALLKTSLIYLDSMLTLYPSNKFYVIYKAFATIRLTDITNQNKSNSEKKICISIYEENIKHIDDYAPTFLKDPVVSPTARYFMEQAQAAKLTLKQIKFEIE